VPFTVAGIILKVPVEQQCQKHWEFKRDSISAWFIDEGLKFYLSQILIFWCLKLKFMDLLWW